MSKKIFKISRWKFLFIYTYDDNTDLNFSPDVCVLIPDVFCLASAAKIVVL